MSTTFTITFINPNIVQLVNASNDVCNLVDQSIKTSFGDAVFKQYDAPRDHISTFTLQTHPFYPIVENADHVGVRRFTCDLLGGLHDHGWHVKAAMDLQYAENYATWFMEKHETENIDKSKMVCIAPRSWNLLTFINMTDEMTKILIESIDSFVDKKAKLRADSLDDSTTEISLKGRPWQSNQPEDDVNARLLMIKLCKQMMMQGYELYTTVGLKTHTDSLVFRETTKPAHCHYAAVSLNSKDKIICFYLSTKQHDALRCCIQKNWSNGIWEENEYPSINMHEFTLHQRPWTGWGDETIEARVLVAKIMETLLSNGLQLVTPLKTTRWMNDKATFILRSCQPVALSQPTICLAPIDTSSVYVINANESCLADVESAVKNSYSAGITQTQHLLNQALGIRLNGKPWNTLINSVNDDQCAAHLMIIQLIEMLNKAHSLTFIYSADVANSYYEAYTLDCHTIFVTQTNGIMREMSKEEIATEYGQMNNLETKENKMTVQFKEMANEIFVEKLEGFAPTMVNVQIETLPGAKQRKILSAVSTRRM